MHEEKHGDFVLDFDYKLSKGCNSGVFVRVGDPKDPVNTGLEIAIDDTTGTGLHDPGAFYDLVAPTTNAQKPAGEWNHMTVTADGPKIAVRLNGKDVSAIDLDEFDEPGKRPDGSSHKFGKCRHQGPRPVGLPRLPGPRARLLVQEHQDQRTRLILNAIQGPRESRLGPAATVQRAAPAASPKRARRRASIGSRPPGSRSRKP